MLNLKKYRIYDTYGGLLSDNSAVYAKSPIEAVRKLYINVKRVKNGHIVVNHRYCYEGDRKEKS